MIYIAKKMCNFQRMKDVEDDFCLSMMIGIAMIAYQGRGSMKLIKAMNWIYISRKCQVRAAMRRWWLESGADLRR